MRSTVALAHALGVARPRVAFMAATETVKGGHARNGPAPRIDRRRQRGEFAGLPDPGPVVLRPGLRRRRRRQEAIGGPVVGAADIMVFPDLLSANLTVKAIMYTADCRFGGVLCGTAAPVVFMSRADDDRDPAQLARLDLALLASADPQTLVLMANHST